MARAFLLTAVAERGMCARGLPRNPGDPVVSAPIPGRTPGEQTADPGRRARPRRGANSEPSAVRPSEGNEARPEGRQGVGALRSTGGAGELAPEDPVREGGAGSGNRWRERWPGHRIRKP